MEAAPAFSVWWWGWFVAVGCDGAVQKDANNAVGGDGAGWPWGSRGCVYYAGEGESDCG